jgi:hypothetical protein
VAILQLLASKDETLVVLLDLGLDVANGIRGLHLQGDGLASEGPSGGAPGGGYSFWML